MLWGKPVNPVIQVTNLINILFRIRTLVSDTWLHLPEFLVQRLQAGCHFPQDKVILQETRSNRRNRTNTCYFDNVTNSSSLTSWIWNFQRLNVIKIPEQSMVKILAYYSVFIFSSFMMYNYNLKYFMSINYIFTSYLNYSNCNIIISFI